MVNGRVGPLVRRSAGEPVGIRDRMGILRPVGLPIGPRAVSRIVRTVAEQPSGGRQREQTKSHPPWLTQRPAFPAVGGRDDRPLEHVPNIPEVVLAVSSQAEGGLGEFLFAHARPEFDDQMSLNVAGIPQAMLGSRWNGEGLA